MAPGHVVSRRHLMEIEAGRYEHPLRPYPCRHEAIDSRQGISEAGTGANALVGGGGGAVERDLHTANPKARQRGGGRAVDQAAIGLDLERHTGVRQNREQIPAKLNRQRLAAAERDIGNVERNRLPRQIECLGPLQFIGPSPIGTGLLATSQALRFTAVGQLPGQKKRGGIIVQRPARHRHGRSAQVKRI